jgi:hypothetical protein
MTYFEHTKSDLSRAINIAIEETLTEVTRKIRELPASSSPHDPFPWRTGRDEALGAATKIGTELIRAKVYERLDS